MFDQNRTSIDFAELANMSLSHIEGIVFRHVDPEAVRRGPELFFCDSPGGSSNRRMSASINIQTGHWNLRGNTTSDAQGGRDVISLVAYAQGVPQPEAAEIVAEQLGVEVPRNRSGFASTKRNRPPENTRTETSKDRSAINRALSAWEESRDARGTPAELYLRSRGIDISDFGDDDLRYLALPDGSPSSHALVLPITDRFTGVQSGLQRVFLNSDGTGYPNEKGKTQKRTLGRKQQAGIWFGADVDTIIMVEGPEDAMSVYCALPDACVVSTIDAGHMGKQSIPSVVRRIIVIPDAGAAGEDGLRRVVNNYPDLDILLVRLPDGMDANDMLCREGPEALQSAIEGATSYRLPDRPEALLPAMDAATPFPIDALGGILADAAKAIAEMTQADASIACQSVLAGANLAAQDCIDVFMPRGGDTPDIGSAVPVSEFFIAVGTSGTRKTSADKLALAPHRAYEKELRIAHAEAKKQWKTARAAYELAKKRVEKALPKEATQADIESALERLTEPDKPLDPQLIYDNATIQGLFKALSTNEPRIGLISDDAGKFFGGHSMTAEQKIATFANFNNAWDGRDMQRVLASEDKIVIRGVRMSIFMQVQPKVIEEFVSDDLAADQGFHARFLITAPDTRTEARAWRVAPESAQRFLDLYNDAITAALKEPRDTDEEGNPVRRPMYLSMEAFEQHIAFYNELQAQLVKYGSLVPIAGFAEKGHEHACRVSATMQFIDDPKSIKISRENYTQAVVLVRYYASEALRLMFRRNPDKQVKMADHLRHWLLQKADADGDEITLREMTRHAPRQAGGKLRNVEMLKVVQLLVQHGHLKPTDDTKRWRIVADRAERLVG
ncbi:MAG: DUF3987 domain-containing protein [Hyphomicrobiaceae bacterium]